MCKSLIQSNSLFIVAIGRSITNYMKFEVRPRTWCESEYVPWRKSSVHIEPSLHVNAYTYQSARSSTIAFFMWMSLYHKLISGNAHQIITSQSHAYCAENRRTCIPAYVKLYGLARKRPHATDTSVPCHERNLYCNNYFELACMYINRGINLTAARSQFLITQCRQHSRETSFFFLFCRLPAQCTHTQQTSNRSSFYLKQTSDRSSWSSVC